MDCLFKNCMVVFRKCCISHNKYCPCSPFHVVSLSEQLTLIILNRHYELDLYGLIICTFRILPPATKLGQGNIFRSVCQELCPQGGGIGIQVCLAGHMTSQGGVQAQAQAQGGVQVQAQGVSRPRSRGVQAPAGGGGCIPAFIEADTPPQQTATAAGGTLSTGPHFCTFMFRVRTPTSAAIW